MTLIEAITDAEYVSAVTAARLATPGNAPHCPLGPSSLYRARRCRASVLGSIVCASADTAGKDATDGTRRHAFFARAISGGDIREDELQDGDAEHIAMARSIVATTIREATGAANSGDILAKFPEAPIEAGGIYGTCDLLVVCGKVGYVLDWKTGHNGGYEPATLEQLQAYASMAVLKYSLDACHYAAALTDPDLKGDRIVCGGCVTAEYAGNWLEVMRQLRKECYDPAAPFCEETGPQCAYCRVAAAGRCPVARAEAERAAAAIAPDALAVIPQQALATAEDADAWLVKLATLRDYLEPLEAKAKALIADAGGSESFAVVNVSGRKTADWKGLVKAHGIQPAEIAEYETVGEPSIQIRRRK